MRAILFLCIALWATTIRAQSNKTDSLINLLNKNLKDTNQVNILNDLSYEFSETDTAAAHRYAGLALAKATKINYVKGMADAYNNIAYVYSLLYLKDVSASYYEKGIAISIKHNSKKTLATGYQDYAVLLKSQGKFKEALYKNLEAIKIYESLRDSAHLALIYTNTGNCYSNLNLFEQAVAYHIKSLKINQSRENNVGIARAYNNIGIVYERNGNFEKAHENYLRMLKPAKASGKKALIAAANCNIGSSYENLKQPAKALPYIKIALSQEEELGNKARIGLNLNNIAAAYNDLHQYQNALKASLRAMKVAREADDNESLAYAYITAGTAAAGLNKYPAAQAYMDTAYTRAKQENRAGLLLSTYEQAGRVYKETGNLKKAIAFSELLITLKDSTYNAEKHAQIAALQEQYDSQRKDQLLIENELAAAKSKIQLADKNKLLLIAIIVMISLIVLVFLIVRNMKLQRSRLQAEKSLATAAAEQELLNEKLRISSELHDNIGSQLTFIHASLQTLKRDSGSATANSLEEAEIIAINTIRDLRQTVWFINNSSFSLEDFTIRLREYLRPYDTLNSRIFQVTNHIDSPINLSAAAATHLFRIVQEAVNNSIKYASASQIQIDILNPGKGILSIKITDNGKGFDPGQANPGFGLRNMQARAAQCGGELDIQSSPETGTSITLNIPV